MFPDEPRFILPLEFGDKVTLSWDTEGPLAGPFASPINSEPRISRSARRFLDKKLTQLESYLPFDFVFKKDNRNADIRISVSDGPITVQGVTLGPLQVITGIIVPGESSHQLVLAQEPGSFWVNTTYKMTALHEVGHALGLTHPGTGGADPAYTTADTIMSYNVTDPSPFYRPLDLQRLQQLWGWNKGDLDPITGLKYKTSQGGTAYIPL